MKKLLVVLLFLPLLSIAQNKKITFDDIYKLGTFRQDFVAGFHSMNDGRFYMELSDKGLLRNNFITGQTIDTLIASSDVRDEQGKVLSLDDVEWNSDEKKSLIFVDREHIYRRS